MSVRELGHRCKHGGTSNVVRDAESFGIPVWRCSGLCGTFFAVVDGGLGRAAGGLLPDSELELLGSSDPAGTTETS